MVPIITIINEIFKTELRIDEEKKKPFVSPLFSSYAL